MMYAEVEKRMKKKVFTNVLFALLFAVCFNNIAYAKGDPGQPADVSAVPVSNSSQSSSSPILNVSNKSEPVLIPPVVEDPKLSNQKKSKKQEVSKKMDLRAVIFDPDADFKAQAEDEGREMTRLEKAEDSVHEALHGEVTETSKLSRRGLLAKELTVKPEGGIFESLNLWAAYKGSLQDSWLGDQYANSVYDTDSTFVVLEGKLKDKKTSFRSMFLVNPGKEGHDFFNDIWGDQYIMYSWTKQDQLLVGYSRNAVGIEGSASPLVLPLFARSQIAKAYNNVRALGAKAQGEHKLYSYNIGMFSSGRYFMDWFPGPEFVGSFGIKPLGMTNGKYGKLLIGGGLDAGNSDSHYAVGSAYVDYEYKRLNATVEYGSADGSNGSTGFTTNRSEGINGTIAYRITPKWQVLVRYDQFDPNKDKKNDIRREYTAGINYFLKEQSLRLMLNYTVYSIETGVYGSKILIGTQIIL